MMELASEEDKDAYSGLFYFMKGWNFWRCTMSMGDIPYSQALDIEEYRYPVYDSQKDVFIGVLSDLEKQINSLLQLIHSKVIRFIKEIR